MKRIALTACLLAASVAPALAQMDMSNPPAMPAAMIARVTSGTKLTFVVRVDKVNRTTVTGTILDPVSGNTYRVTSSVISLHVANDLPIIMGSHDDLKPGAVVFAYGVATKPKQADATKLVLITPYVKTK